MFINVFKCKFLTFEHHADKVVELVTHIKDLLLERRKGAVLCHLLFIYSHLLCDLLEPIRCIIHLLLEQSYFLEAR